MAEYLVEPKSRTRPPVHPGVIFGEEIMPGLRARRTVGEIARLLGVSRATLHRLMAGEIAMSPEMAARIGKLVGNGAGLWLRLQAKYDEWEATRRLAKELSGIPTLGGESIPAKPAAPAGQFKLPRPRKRAMR
jgi:addiction module HigA family antidote